MRLSVFGPLVFLDDLDSSLVLLIEGLMMDFLGTIDRTLRTIAPIINNGRGLVRFSILSCVRMRSSRRTVRLLDEAIS